MPSKSRADVWILTLIIGGASLLYVASLTTDSFGYYHDDGVYVATAKALATGHGYHIISLPYEPAQTKYPPFYPFLLSLIWRTDPHFPANLFQMMLLSTIATSAFLTLTWLYLTKTNYVFGWQASLLIALTAINSRTTILATNIYSEMLYSALSIGALWLAEEQNRGQEKSWLKHFTLGVVLGLAFLTRTSGISLIMAVILFCLLRRQGQKATLIFAVAGFFVCAWAVWCATNETRTQTIIAPYYTSYLWDFIERVGNLATFLKIIGINTFMLLVTSIPLVSLGIGYGDMQNFMGGSQIVISLFFICLVFLLALGGFLKHLAAGFRLLHLYVLLYLGLHLLWPFTSYDRFLVPILPFLLFFLTTEIRVVAGLVRNELRSTIQSSISRKLCAAFVGSLLLLIIGVGYYNYASGMYRSVTAKEFFSKRASEDRQAIDWIIQNTPPSAVLVCYRDPQYYLYAGRKAVRSFVPRSSAQDRTEEPQELILRIISQHRGQYLIFTSSDFEQESESDFLRKTYESLVKRFPETFFLEFQSVDGRTAIYSIRNTIPS